VTTIITVTWKESVDVGYGDYAYPERDIEIEWDGPIDPIDADAVSNVVENRVEDRWTDFHRITEIKVGEETIWYCY